MEITVHNVSQALLVCRDDLLTNVVQKRVYGDVSNAWQFDGHIFITTDEGRKLFTFDCKPLLQQQIFDSKCLDTSVLSTHIIDVLKLSSQLMALVQADGHVAVWRFSTEFHWLHEGSFQIGTASYAEVISVTYLSGCTTICWCEKRPAAELSSSFTYCLCKRQLDPDLDPQKVVQQSRSSILIQNCPILVVHSISSDGLFITTEFDSEQVTVHLIIDFVSSLMHIFIGEEYRSQLLLPFQEIVDFQDIVMNSLLTLTQTQPGLGDLGVRSDSTSGQTAVLSSGGQLGVYNCLSDSRKLKLTKEVVMLSDETGKAVDVVTRNWFLQGGFVGIICSNTVQMFRVADGKFVCKSIHESVRNVQKVITSTSPVFLSWILTKDHLFALQVNETKKEMYTAPSNLPDDHLFQTDVMKLSHLHELRLHGYNLTYIKELEQLKEKWTDTKGLSHHSHISHTIAPYLEEYWRLESFSQMLIHSEKQQTVIKSHVSSAEQMVKMLKESRNLSKSSQHAKLLWLSQAHPKELLDNLSQGITFDTSMVPASEMKKWQSLLGMEGGSLLNFQFLCRLLFKEMPAELLNFVKFAESVSEQTVGVSAFVRKKHSLIYYKTALECLPHSQTSSDPEAAAYVKAKLILASECENCTERALKHLLKHGLWSEAVGMVKQQAKTDGFPAYLHTVIKALAENHVLSDYASEIFEVMNSWKSFLLFSQLAMERPEIRKKQLSNSVNDVFCHGGTDVKLAAVKPYLLHLIKEGTTGNN